MIEALKRVPGEPTREALLDAIAKAPIDLGGVKFSFGPTNNQGSNKVYFTILQPDGAFKPVSKLVKAAAP